MVMMMSTYHTHTLLTTKCVFDHILKLPNIKTVNKETVFVNKN